MFDRGDSSLEYFTRAGCGSMFQSDIVGVKTILCLAMSDNERQLMHVP
jgi:hypothetical protein